jgi:hypothetical protein
LRGRGVDRPVVDAGRSKVFCGLITPILVTYRTYELSRVLCRFLSLKDAVRPNKHSLEVCERATRLPLNRVPPILVSLLVKGGDVTFHVCLR